MKKQYGSWLSLFALITLTIALFLPNAVVLAVTPIYVRPGGSDTVCDGTVDADFNGSNAPNCAVQTINQGIYLVETDGSVEISAGTYNENVVVDKSVTLQGAGIGLTVLDGNDKSSSGGTGITLASDIDNVEIYDLSITEYTTGILRAANDPAVTENIIIEDVDSSDNYNAGIHFSGSSPAQNIRFTRITANNNDGPTNFGRGIFMQSHDKQNIIVEDGTFNHNRISGIDLNIGSLDGVRIMGNTVSGNNITNQVVDSGIAILGLVNSGSYANEISGNTVSVYGRFGIEIKGAHGNGNTSGLGSFVVSNNTVTHAAPGAPLNLSATTENRDIAGIAVGNINSSGDTSGVVVQNNTVSGFLQSAANTTPDPDTSTGFCISISGTDYLVTENDVDNCDVGIQEQQGFTGDQNTTGDEYFGRDNSTVACGTVTANTFGTNTVNQRQVGTIAAASITNTDSGENFCSIQNAIDATNTLNGHTITVGAGTYVEELYIDKSLTILGPNNGVNPNTDSRSTEAVLLPSTSNPDPDVCTVMAYLATSSITIDGFTFDGDNPALTSGITIGSADVDACEILAGYEGMGSIRIENNILQHSTYSAIDFYNYYDNTATSDNYIRYNLIRNVGETTYNWGIGILIYNNFYADITDNILDNVRVGIQTGNFYRSNPGGTGQISQNEINAWRLGIFHNLWYSNASTISVDNNTINAIDSTGAPTWNGMLISSWQNSTSTLIVDNLINIGNITQLSSGYNVWNTPTTADLTISGGTVNGGDYGVFVNNYDGYNSNASDTSIIVEGVTLDGAVLAGVYAKDNTSNTNGASVEGIIRNSTVTNSPIAFQIEGPDASLTAKGNTVDGNTNIFYLADGDLLAYANNITNFTDGGLNSATGTFNARHNWWSDYTIQPTGVDSDSWAYLLGAPVSTWVDGITSVALADGSAGADATFSGAGTLVIVNHGAGLANVPFGKGISADTGANQCADFYDFFAIGGSGSYGVAIPVNSGCTSALIDAKLFQFTLDGSGAPDLTCTPDTACWNSITATRIGDILTANVATGDVLGTPFTAPSYNNNDPTAVSLREFKASGSQTSILAIVLGLGTVLVTGLAALQRKRS